jgi:hypothetical protein
MVPNGYYHGAVVKTGSSTQLPVRLYCLTMLA